MIHKETEQLFYFLVFLICGKSARKYEKTGVKQSLLRFGGGGWIRTTEAKRNRFTVCPLWPLGNSSVFSWCPNQIEAQRSGFDLERSRTVESELSRLRGSERSGRCGDVELVDGFEPPTC